MHGKNKKKRSRNRKFRYTAPKWCRKRKLETQNHPNIIKTRNRKPKQINRIIPIRIKKIINSNRRIKKTNTKTNRAIKPILLLKNEFNSIRTRKTKKPT